MGRALKPLLGAAALPALGFLALAACSGSFRANVYSAVQRDDAPFEPFEIAPDLYYVGSSDIAVYALDTDDGIVVINGGYERTGRRVPENLRALGMDVTDVRLLLNTHAHMDHAAGLAALKAMSGAQLYASPGDAPLLEAGGRGDFALGSWMTYPAVEVDRTLSDGEVVELGGRALTAHFTPGHTRGCTSWSFTVEIDAEPRNALLVCSLAILWYRLVDNPRHPEIADDFRASFATLEALPCDLFLADHARFFDLRTKQDALADGAPTNPFLDPAGCRAYIADAERDFRARLERQSRNRRP